MKIAVGTDMKTSLAQAVVQMLAERGHDVDMYGAFETDTEPWPQVAIEVAEKVAAGEYEQAIVCCWTGTGISIAANKVSGIRAALCGDAETASGARKWNDANVLALSLRATSEEVAREIIDAWLSTGPSSDPDDVACLKFLSDYDRQ